MDINSPEFFTLAFVLAMALVAMLIGKREKRPPSTHIVQLVTTDADGDADDDVLVIEPQDRGRVRLSRAGLSLAPEETVNLVITIQEDHCSIVEKKGVKRRGAPAVPVTGEAVLKCFKPGMTYRMRYESQLTSTWATFTLDTMSPTPIRITLKY